jgi:uncharacterized HAD superfamily protein
MKKVIAIDYDDVIVPSAPIIVRSYNEKYGTNVQLKDFYYDDPRSWGSSDTSTVNQRVGDYLMSEEYQATLPFTEAIDALRLLSEQHELHIVTGRTDYLADVTKNMLNKYLPGIFRSVEFTNFFGQNRRSKAEVCQALDADLLIDDHLHHAQVVADCGIDVLLFGDYPWNQAKQLPANIRRVSGWHEITELLLTPAPKT